MSVATRTRIGLRSVARLNAVPVPAALDLESSKAREADRLREMLEEQERRRREERAEFVAFGDPKWKQPLQRQLNKSFSLHLGADLQLPCPAKPVHPPEGSGQAAVTPKTASRPFDEVPFAAFAEKIGAAVAPVYHDFKQMEQDESRHARHQAQTAEPWEPPVPHFLPFTRMAIRHNEFRKTFVFDETNRKTARLSWYHPDDTMVPRDWFQGGLLADLRYYFGKK